MFQRDLFHQAVVVALEKEDWTVTHDPYFLEYGAQTLQVDLGAEMPVAAERNGRKIALEIKSFAGKTQMSELYGALGQFVLYRNVLRKQEPERKLYLAVPEEAYLVLFDPAHGRDLRDEEAIALLIYSAEEEVIVTWIE